MSVRPVQDEELVALEAALATTPGAPDLLYRRAGLLALLGRDDDAKQAFLALLAVAPTHRAGLNDFGTLLYRTGYRSAARTVYAEAVKHHPDAVAARINLGNVLLDDGQHAAARDQFEAALSLAPDHPDAHQGLANLSQDQGDEDAAERHRQASYRARALTVLPYRGAGRPRRVLQLVSARGGNVPTRFLLDDTVFQTSILVVESAAASAPLPPHDLVFNTIGDADLCAPALDLADAVTRRSRAPAINPPARVRPTGRAANAARLAALAHVVAPIIVSVSRSALLAGDGVGLLARHGLGFPVLLRSPGFHTGRHFVRVDAPEGLAAAVAALPGETLMAIQPLDARGVDGKARKYRAMMIDGRIFPLHLAVSADWKVHYFTAEMAARPDFRAEEAAFLADMPAVIGARAMAALEQVASALGLDYAGVDFGVDAGGDLLLFEANATMVVNPPDADPRWDYRRGPVERILAAARDMLIDRAGPV
jgi:tetratricopeptide (TPR) repeat protein